MSETQMGASSWDNISTVSQLKYLDIVRDPGKGHDL
jgi:hypothetical protein